jgi:Integrase core domain
VILDVFSRYVVAWLAAHREQAALAEQLLAEAYASQGIQPGQLTVHADRGSSMTSKPVALLFADLGVTKTHSRPHVSHDNPYSEAQFKTLKYRPAFPARFGSLEHARAVSGDLVHWYNHEHRHSALGLFAGGRPFRADGGEDRATGRGPGGRLRRASGAVPARAAAAARGAVGRVDQPAPERGRPRWYALVPSRTTHHDRPRPTIGTRGSIPLPPVFGRRSWWWPYSKLTQRVSHPG